MGEEADAGELLETLILFIRFQNVKTVGRMLSISPGTVRDRLEGLEIETRLPANGPANVVELNGIEFLAGKITRLQADNGLDLSEMGKEPWNLEEDELLTVTSDDELLAVLLGRSVQAVTFRRKGGGPGQGTNQRRWTDREKAFVLSSPLTIAEIAAELGRTPASTQKMRDRLRHQAHG